MSKIVTPVVFLCTSLLFIFPMLADSNTIPPLRVAVEVPGQDQLRFGTLSFAAEGVKFDSNELLFTVPINDMEDIQVAGFRERFLTVVVRKNSGFSRSYAFLFADSRIGMSNSLSLSFQLGPKETLRTALEAGTQYREQVADQLRANSPAAPEPSSPSSPGIIRSAGPPPGVIGSINSSPVRVDPPLPRLPRTSEDKKKEAATSSAPQPSRELFHLSGRYLEKWQGVGSVILAGTPGDLVFFEDTLGFRSQVQNPRLGPNKTPFVEDGYLKFRIRDKDIENATYHAVNSKDAVLTLSINRHSSFFAEAKALLTETKSDNEVVFLIPAGSSQYQLPNYFHSRVGIGF